MSNRTFVPRRFLRQGAMLWWLFASTLVVGGPAALAQEEGPEEVPELISPLRIETDDNGVNLISGKTQRQLPVLSVPGAPHLRFDFVQNAAPYVFGNQSGSAGSVQSSYSVHTGTGTSASFKCSDFDCTSVTGTGSTFTPNANVFRQAGSRAEYRFNLKHVKTTGTNPVTMLYYASSMTYPNGETITYTYDTATLPGDTFGRTFYRPTRITSNLGFFITIAYQPGTLESGAWGAPAEAAIYNSSDPTTPLGRLTFSADGTTITDLGGRVYTCQPACGNVLGANLEVSSGSLQLPGETSPTWQATRLSDYPLVSSVTRDGVTWNYAYTNIRHAASGTAYLYDKLTVTGPNGYHMVYDIGIFDQRNVLTRITDSIGRVTSVDFDDAYRPTLITYPEGNKVSVVYDNLGNITSRTATPKPNSGLAAVTESAHYPTDSCATAFSDVLCFRPVWHRDGLGRQTDFVYNDFGQLVEQTDPPDANGVRRKTYITYDTTTGISRRSVVRVCGDTTTCGTPDEIRTEYEYWGNTYLPTVVRRIDAARGEVLETHYTYDLAGRVLVEDGPLPGTGDARYFRYDVYGRKSWEIGPADDTGIRLAKRFSYRDSDDKVLRIDEGTLPNETSTALAVDQSTDFAYDDRRNPIRESVSADGATYTLVQRTFDSLGRLQCEARRMNPDAFGALPASACTLGPAGSYGSDRITHNVYDAAGQLLQVQRAYGTALQQDYATYTYTANGKRQTVKDANNNLSTFEYDGFDRLSKLRFPVATKGANQSSSTDYEQYGYDAVGNRTSLRKRDGRTITFSYDALNRVRVKNVPSSVSGAPGYTVHYGYDVQGLMLYARFGSDTGTGITNTYDGFGRLRLSSSNMGGVTRTVASDYDAHGNRTRLTHPDGVFFEYAYDNRDHLFHLSENGPSITLASIFYDEQGRRREIDRDTLGTITTYDYDPVSRLKLLSHDLDGSGTTNDVAMTFSYNPASQIVTRTLTNDAYEYPLANSVRTYAVNGLNQYTQITDGTSATLSWDANGNLTSDGATTFGYDTENRLTSASGAKNATLSYDPLGHLYQVTTPSGVIRFLYDGDRLIAEYDGSGALLRRYVHGAGIDEPLVWYEGAVVSAANRRYFHANHQGSIVALTDASGTTLQVNAYDPYGVTGASNTGRFQYTGQTAIPELGLYYYKARFYNPNLGRFMQTDPVGYDDDVNLYTYTSNDPINNLDPNGEFVLQAGAIIGGAVLGVIVQAAVDIKNGSFSGPGTYAAAALGGAVAGAIVSTTGNFVAAGAAGAAISDAGSQLAKTGKINLVQTGVAAAVGAVAGGAAKAVPALRVPGITAGRNSAAAVAKAADTKLANGTISSVSPSTLGKAAAAEVVGGAGEAAAEATTSEVLQGAVASGVRGLQQGARDLGNALRPQPPRMPQCLARTPCAN